MTQEEFHKRYQYNPSTDCLGEGGFGKVYKAYDKHRDRNVAIKMAEVKPHLEEVRLKKEVEMISKLPTHPNIAYYEECYSFATFAGEYDFGILQYYEVGNLQQLVHSAQLTDDQKDSILRQIMDGIAFLHQQGIIHRDLKPQNILIVNRNGEYIPKITDFGISKQLDASHSSIFTNSLSGAGTLAFASPEQLCGQAIRKNTDLWSFGVIACWLFTSKLPFATSTQIPTNEGERIELYKQITKGELSSMVEFLPSEWYSVVAHCLIVDCDNRITDAAMCVDILDGELFVESDFTRIIEPKVVKKTAKKKTRFDLLKPIKAVWSFIRKWKVPVFALLLTITIGVGGYLHWVYKYHYDDAYSFNEGLAAVKKGDKWGFIDKKGSLVIPYIYDSISYLGRFHEGLSYVNINKQWGFIDIKGRMVLPCNYFLGEVPEFQHGLIEIKKRQSNGSMYSAFMNKKGKIVSAFYDKVRGFSDDLAAVIKDDLIGYIDTLGNEVIKCRFIANDDFQPDFNDGIARLVKYNNGFGTIEYSYIDKTGTVVLQLNKDKILSAENFERGLAIVYLANGGRAMININGQFMRKFEGSVGDFLDDGIYRRKKPTVFIECATIIKENNKIGFAAVDGFQFVPFKYSDAYEFSDGRAAVKNDLNKWGFINRNGAEIIPLKYDHVQNFRDGFAAVGKGNIVNYDKLFETYHSYKWGYVDEMGKETIPCQFDSAKPFHEGVALVRIYGKGYGGEFNYYFIGKDGKTIGSWY